MLVSGELVVGRAVMSGIVMSNNSAVSAKWFMSPKYPDDMAEEEEERVVGRWSVQLNPEREVTPKVVSKTKSNSERRYG